MPSIKAKWAAIIPKRAEIAFDAHRIPHADLNVIFRGKAGILVETLAFEKGGANCVERLFTFMTLKPMKVSNNSAIEPAKEPMAIKTTGRERGRMTDETWLRERIRFLPSPIVTLGMMAMAASLLLDFIVEAHSVFAFIALMAIETLAIVNIFKRRRCQRRLKWLLSGHCIECGYDLRASTALCPECGAPIATANPLSPSE